MSNKITVFVTTLIPFFIFIITLGVYFKTLAPTISSGDSGEFVTAAATLGIPHAPGYPLYTLLGHLFSLIPLNSVAWRLNFMSAIFMSGAIALFYILILTTLRIVRQKSILPPSSLLIALSVSFMLGFSYSLWRYAVVADVFSLNFFFSVLSFLVLLRWFEKNSHGEKINLFSNIYFSIFILSLGIANHHSIILLVPAFIFLIKASGSNLFSRPIFYRNVILLGFMGLSFYIYLPLTAAANPILNWGNPITVENAIRVFLRSDYGTFFLSPMQHSQILTANSIALAIINFGKEVVAGSSFLVLLLFPFGIILSYHRCRSLSITIILSLSFSLLTFLFLGEIQATEPIWGELIKKFYILPYLPIFMLVAIGLDIAADYLINKMTQADIFLKTTSTIFGLLILTGIPVLIFSKQHPKADQSTNTLVYDFGNNILSSIEPGSIFLSYGENNAFSLLYLLYIEKQRPDIIFIDQALLSYPWYKDTLTERYPKIKFPSIDSADPTYITQFITLNLSFNPIYFESLSTLSILESYDIEPHGLVRKIIPFNTQIDYPALFAKNENLFSMYRKDGLSIYDYPLYSYEGVLIEHWVRSYQTLGNMYLSQKEYENAERWYRQAPEIWPQHEDVMNSLEALWKEKRDANI